jgi:hypothetical protein
MLNISIAYSQEVHLRGSVVDGKTNLPIAEATISISAKGLFYPADNKGEYNIGSDQIISQDTITISCVGYQTKKLTVRDMELYSIVKLSPMINMLKEVRIGINSPANIIVGSKAKFTGGTAGLKPGTEIAMFMAGSENIKGNIQTVCFFVSNGHSVAKGGDATAPFRVRLYGVDTSGIPGTELTKDIIIVAAKKNEEWFDVDLSAYHIKVPRNGFFVSFGLLDSTYYKLRRGYFDYNLASPRLGTQKTPTGECISYLGENTTFGWEWYKSPYNDNYMIHATILKD